MRGIVIALLLGLGCRDTAPDLGPPTPAADSPDPQGPAWEIDDAGAPPDRPRADGSEGPPGPTDPPGPGEEGEGEGEGEPAPPADREDPVAAAECDTRFRLPLGRAGAEVRLAGEWAGWDPAAGPMSDGNGEGVYETALRIPPGSWGYKLVVDGEWIADPTHERTKYVDGVANSRVDVRDCERPPVRPVRGEASHDGRAWIEDSTGRVHRFEGLAPGRHDLAVGDGVAPVWIEDEPFDVRDGPIYFVLVDRFRNGDPGNDAPVGPPVAPQADWQGGDLQGVRLALEEGWFEALGVRTLWLSPLNEAFSGAGAGKDGRSYSGYHGYWPISARTVEPRLGGGEALQALVEAAHERGIRIIADLVWNQAHREHAYVADHPDWFRGDGGCVCGGPGCGWDDRALDCWFTDYLPDVDWRNMQAVQAMRADALWWLTDAGLDGFRVDAVKHMEEIAVTTLRAAIDDELSAGGATFHLVGETFTGQDGHELVARYVGPTRLHAQFDFPLFWVAMDAFARESVPMSALAAAAETSKAAYDSRVMSPFLGNHDVERFMSRAADDLRGDPVAQGYDDPPARPDADLPFERARLAFAWLLTQPGAPLIYYGDEVGLPGAGDPDNRRMMRFSGDLNAREAALLAHIREWAAQRTAHPALRRGGLTTLHADEELWIYQRGAGPGAVVVGLNRAAAPASRQLRIAGREVTVEVPARQAISIPAGEL